MSVPKKLLLALGAAVALLLPAITPALAQNVPSTVQIVPPATCGLSINPTSINYGSQSQADTSAEVNLLIANTGNAPGAVTIQGTNWVDAGNVAQMGVGQTHYGTPSTTWAAKTAVTTGAAPLGTVNPSTAVQKAFQLQVNLGNPAFTGTLSQTLTFASNC